ncbi:MAG: hypothetical protein J6L73_01655 [Muribaculaceae bacterium]|nr:hypothetical protein [Muribaculaceae bacterium]
MALTIMAAQAAKAAPTVLIIMEDQGAVARLAQSNVRMTAIRHAPRNARMIAIGIAPVSVLKTVALIVLRVAPTTAISAVTATVGLNVVHAEGNARMAA